MSGTARVICFLKEIKATNQQIYSCKEETRGARGEAGVAQTI
jgi:hypothetical protein